jgi:flagellar FliL protein
MKLPVLILIVLLTALLTGGGLAAGGYFFLLPQLKAELGIEEIPEEAEEAEEAGEEEGEIDPADLPLGEGEPQYFAFSKPLLISLDSQADAKFLQLAFSILVHHQALVDELTQREPELRNDLIIRLGAERPEELRTPEGRERLRATILTAVRERVGPHVDEEAQTRFEIDDVLLTNLVMQ